MSVIGSLLVNLKANTAQFDKKMKGSRKRMSAFAKSAQATERAMKLVTAAVGAFAVVRTVQRTVGFLEQSLQKLDKLGKVADKLGIATEHLLALRHAAKLTGIETTTLDMALQRMVRRIAEAGQGTGEAQAALKELGLDAERLAKVSPWEQFKALADAMQNVRTEGDKLRLSFKLFDSEGAALKNTLALGSKGLKDMDAQLKKLGASFTRIDVARAEAAVDALTRMKVATDALAQSFIIEMSDFIAAGADAMTRLGTEGKLSGDILIDVFESVAQSIAQLLNLGKQLSATGAFFALLGASGSGSNIAVMLALDNMNRALDDMETSSENIAKAFDKIRADAKAAAAARVAAGVAGGGAGGGIDPAAMRTAEIEQRRVETRRQTLMRDAEAVRQSLKSLARLEDDVFQKLVLLHHEGLLTLKEFNLAADANEAKFKKLRDAGKDKGEGGLLGPADPGTFAEITTIRRSMRGVERNPLVRKADERNKILKSIDQKVGTSGGFAA